MFEAVNAGWMDLGVIRAHEVVGLATGQVETNRVAECINQRVDFGAQSAARTPDRLVHAVFF